MKKTVWLSDNSHFLAAFLIIIQPVLDVISYWMSEFGMSNSLTLLLRMGVLGITLLWAFVISDKKHVYFFAASIMAAIYAGHIYACLEAGYVDPIADFTNFIRVVQMPVLVLAFITFMRKDKKAFDYIQLGASVALLIMFAVEIISTITGTDPHTYSDGTGIIGWFYNTNSQSSNLCVLAPILLLWVINQKKRRPVLIVLTSLVCCLSMFLFSTRLAYLGLMAFAIGMGVMMIVLRRNMWRYGTILISMGLVFAALLPVSPMYTHLKSSNSIQTERQQLLDAELSENRDDINNLIGMISREDEEETTEVGEFAESDLSEETDDNTGKITEDEKKRLIEELTPIYEKYVGDFVKRFGVEKTMKMYNYTLDVREFASTRAKKLMFAEMLVEDSPASAKWFGVEISRFTFDGTIYDVENDFHGIYFLYGGVGFAAYMVFLAYFAVIIIKALVKNFKKYFTLEAVAYGISLIVCMAHCYNTAGVLRRPNSSVYLSVVLAVIYYLIYIREYDEPAAVQKAADQQDAPGKNEEVSEEEEN